MSTLENKMSNAKIVRKKFHVHLIHRRYEREYEIESNNAYEAGLTVLRDQQEYIVGYYEKDCSIIVTDPDGNVSKFKSRINLALDKDND